MATTNGTNAALTASVPSQEIPVTDQGGKIRVMYDSVTPASALQAGDIVKMGALLPAGARIINAVLAFAAQGAGNLELGVADNGVDGASAAGLVPAQAVTSAGQATLQGQSTLPAFGFKKLGAATQVQVQCTVNTSSPALIQAAVYYTFD